MAREKLPRVHVIGADIDSEMVVEESPIVLPNDAMDDGFATYPLLV